MWFNNVFDNTVRDEMTCNSGTEEVEWFVRLIIK